MKLTMATIRASTNLSQSRKLAEILSPESADMMYHSVENEYGSGAFVAISKVITNGFENDDFYIDDIPCWSLTALLNVLPKGTRLLKSETDNTYHCDCPKGNIDKWFDNPVDACYEMIIKLHKMNLL